MSHVTEQGVMTAMEYSPFAFYVSLAIQDIRAASLPILQLARAGKGEEAYALYEFFISTLFRRGHPSAESKKANLRSIGSTFTEAPGLPEASVIDFIRGVTDYSLSHGMLVGIPQEKSGVIVGDISEAGGLDYEGNTAKRIYRLSQALHSASRGRDF